MLAGIHNGAFSLRVISPQHEYQTFVLSTQVRDHSIGELLPAFALMRTSPAMLHTQNRIEQQNTLLGPACETAMLSIQLPRRT